MNAFRKEHGIISSSIPVPDARCPLIRLIFRKPCILGELSIQNILGEIKANFIRNIVEEDNLGNSNSKEIFY